MAHVEPRPSRTERVAAWAPAAILACLTISYVASGSVVRAPATGGATLLLAVATAVQIRRGRGVTSVHPATWLPIAVPAVLSRTTESTTSLTPAAQFYVATFLAATVTVAGVDLRRAIAAIAHAIAQCLRFTVGIAIGIVLVLPIGVARLWRRTDPLGTGRVRAGGGTTAWHDTSKLAPKDRRPYRLERPPPTTLAQRALRLAPVVGVVAVVGLISTTRPTDPAPLQAGLPYTSYAHEDEPWAHELFDEQTKLRVHRDPRVGDRLENRDTGMNRIHRDERWSWKPPRASVEVWMFGGSSLYGIGQRDDHTVPSVVAKLAARDGLAVRVRNFGVPAYVRWQEVRLLELVLADRQAPDLVVFYDGFNDVSLYCGQMAAGVDPRTNGVINGQPFPAPRDDAGDCTAHPVTTGSAIAHLLEDQVSKIGAIRHVVAYQPSINTTRSRFVDGSLLERTTSTPDQRRRKAVIQRTVAAETPGAIDLTRALDDATGPTLFDWVHTNEYGARLVASKLYEALRPELARLAARDERPGG